MPVTDLFEFIQYPFMQRAFIAGAVLAALLAYLGVFVVIRKMAFYSSGMAHASLAGVAFGVLISVNPLFMALVATILFSMLLFFLEKKFKLGSDAIIGLLFSAGMAVGVILISLHEGYQPELIAFLFGDILTISFFELVLMLGFGTLILVFLIFNTGKLTLFSIHEEMAYLSGMRTTAFELLLNVVLAVAVVLGIKILGIVLVSALFVIPVLIAKLVSRSFRALLIWSVVFSEIFVLSGLALAYYFDLPAGAAIVLVGTLLFFAGVFFKGWKFR